MNTPFMAPDKPTRHPTSEESAMRMNLHTQTSNALLCSDACVDAQKTNSLCCAAAGITACACANAGAFTPHQKLHWATTPNATLIAQDRPPAQPVAGYTPSTLQRTHCLRPTRSTRFPKTRWPSWSAPPAEHCKASAPEGSSPKASGTPSTVAFTTASGDTRHGSKANGIAHRS